MKVDFAVADQAAVERLGTAAYAASSKASAARRAVVAFGSSLAFVSFLDRAAISQVAPAIVCDLHLDPRGCDWCSPRSGSPAAGDISERLAVRPLRREAAVDAGRAVGVVLHGRDGLGLELSFAGRHAAASQRGANPAASPGSARLFQANLSPMERNSAEGIKAAAARWGTAITPALMAALYSWFTWRQVFLLFGLIGAAWAAALQLRYRCTLREPRDSEAPVFWKKLVASRSVLASRSPVVLP